MKTFKPIVLALFGTFIEYYDYALYGFAAPILAQYFFPDNEPSIILLQAYGILIAGSCAKPFGSLLFGFLGDRFGRAFALKISIVGIAIPTFMIGLLPDYQTIGFIAPLLLLLCRIFQGIFVSGESDSARVFIFEMLHKKYLCFSNSLAYFICMLGIYCSSYYFNFMTSQDLTCPTHSSFLLPYFEINIPFWRIPFLLAGVFGLILFYLRQNLRETDQYLTFKNQQENNSQSKTVQDMNKKFSSMFTLSNKFSIFITLLMTGAAGGQYYFYFVFLNQYLGKILNKSDPSLANSKNSHMLLCFCLGLPVAGFLADWLSKNFNLISLLKWSSQILIFLALVNFISLYYGFMPQWLLTLTAIALSFSQANTFVVILKQFDVSERCRGSSIGHALGSMILSGSTPFISLWIWNLTRIEAAPFLYFIFLCLISYGALLLLNVKRSTYSSIHPGKYCSAERNILL